MPFKMPFKGFGCDGGGGRGRGRGSVKVGLEEVEDLRNRGFRIGSEGGKGEKAKL